MDKLRQQLKAKMAVQDTVIDATTQGLSLSLPTPSLPMPSPPLDLSTPHSFSSTPPIPPPVPPPVSQPVSQPVQTADPIPDPNPDLKVNFNDANGNDADGDESDSDDASSTSSTTSSSSLSSIESNPSLPEYHCRYCQISNPESVAMCVETGKWFCSSSTPSTSGASHLINHLVRSRSHTVQLHPSGPLGETVLECYNCGARNIFTLGSVPASSTSPIVVILCRACVENVRELKDMEWQTQKWEGLVQERKLVEWLTHSEERDEVGARELTSAQVAKLEDLWKKQPDAGVEDLDRPDVMEEEEVQPIGLVWDDGYHYQNVMAPLIKMEADYDRSIKEALSEERVSLRWDKSLNGKHVVVFSFGRDTSESRLMIGDELILRLSKGGEFLFGKPWEAKGWVKYIDDGELELELRTAFVPDKILDMTHDYVVEFVWKSTSFDRMQNALKTFAIDDSSVSGYIYHSLLGHAVEEQELAGTTVPTNLDVPGLPALNDSQKSALSKVIKSPFSLIQGPPGTGKTVTSATLVYHLAKQKIGQVLVTAPSNIAVDQLTEKIAKTGLKVVRLCSKTRAQMPSPAVDVLSLHVMLPLAAGKEFKKLHLLKEEVGELSNKDEKRYSYLKYKHERQILQAADVICTTCVMAGDSRLRNYRFRQVLIDEATQAVEAEALIPVTLGCKQLVLVGDHLQLPPVVMCKQAAKAGLTQSLFERLVLTGVRPHRLTVQYRMHPALADFPSNMFYEGSLANGVSEADRTKKGDSFPWPASKPMIFFNCPSGIEEISASGTSYLNRTEASHIEKVVTCLMKGGVKGEDIGVITPYDGQKVYVQEYIRRSGSLPQSQYEGVEIASVDSFQGREKDYIIMTCVRSSSSAGIGFLADPRRLNVAITRARLGLILIGNARVLCHNILWGALLVHFKTHKCLVEGSLTNLQATNMLLLKPRIRKRDSEKYRLTALARGSWKGKWDDEGVKRASGRSERYGRGGGKGHDSRYDPKYSSVPRASDDSSVASFAPLPTYGGDEPWGQDSEFGSQYGDRIPGSQEHVSYTQSSMGSSFQDYMDKDSTYSQGSGIDGYYYNDESDKEGSESGYSQSSSFSYSN
eukprot:CAMPEP_0118669890 /NCGR_PEP_ID=MMETSP0785-20121206/21150_1 /TAXON_ID=91992 /ORGANISM="Bolidomonas pacifica, Strain CCMP 1866" /LENGTH=1092 /DNA_ID=CAMNT_0006564619 /DNA_START=185 /DNA_END=3460 /DNA_ORIENTATION=-